MNNINFKTVIFDFDSTLVTIEGIDELARMTGNLDVVSALTDEAMSGKVLFEEVFHHRLRLIKPTKEHLDRLTLLYLKNLTPGAADLITTLQSHDIGIYIVSGGYRQAILPVTSLLGIPPENVFAINLIADPDGFYTRVAGGDILSTSIGKRVVIESLSLPTPVALIGDGNTDALARSAVTYFIGYGGVVAHKVVQDVADYYYDHLDLSGIKLLLNQRRSNARYPVHSR
jgi:phosphoserine phosphatase